MNKYKIYLFRVFFTISRFIPSLAAAKIAEKLFTTPSLQSERREIEQLLLKDAEKFHIPQGKNSIYAYRWGKKTDPIILFVHGWSSSGTCFIKFIKPLISKGYQVISYDSIAHGETKGEKSASITQWADGITSVINTIGSVHCIIGHSLGAGAIIVAASLELKADKIILISPVTNIIKQTEQFAKPLLISDRVLKKMHRYAWQKYSESASKYGRNWQDIFQSDIDVPTLIIHDTNDIEVNIEGTRQLAKRIPKSTFIETSKLGHRAILLNPHVIRATINFLS